jgi:hypothetical protein
MRAAIDQAVEVIANLEDPDLAAPDRHNLTVAGREFLSLGDDMPAHADRPASDLTEPTQKNRMGQSRL